MKNLFKNLMLVAVAAMTFTACTETNEEVNAVAKKTVISGVAVIDTDDTRSGFTGKEGDVYKSAWDGGENIKVFGDNGEEALTTIDADGKFTAEFNQAPNFITVCSPAEAWTSQYSCSIATEQTPRANSVDPAVHVLQSQSTQVVDGSASILVSPQNGCYGKMTIDVADAEIEQVKLDLKGLKYNSYEDSLSYTLNATDTEDNTFWFAIEAPMTVQEFTVTAYCAGDKTLTKTVTIPDGRNLKFDWGRVSTFSVSNLTEEVANVFEPTYLWDQDLIWETDSFKLTDDDYFSAYWRIYLNEADRPGNNSIKEGKYTCAVNNTNPGQGQFCVKIYQGWTNMGTIYASNTFAEDTLEVKIVDGQYQILYTHGTKSHGYKGLPSDFVLPEGGGNEGGSTPTEPTKLATPSVSGNVSGNTATVSWQDVAGAKDYSVSLNGTYYSTVETAYIVLTDLEYSTTYNVSVVANPADATVNSASDAGTASFTTEADPNGGETSTWTFTPSLEGGMMSRYCTFKFTGDDGDTISSYFVYPNKAQVVGTYTVSTLNNLDGTNYCMSEIRLNGIFATSGSGSVTISFTNDGGYLFELDLVLNDKTYKGSAALYL